MSVLAAGELAAIGLESRSQYYRRIRSEDRAAARLRPAPQGSPRTMLIVGNSLLFRGVDFAALRSPFAASRFAVFGTAYYEWFYALRRLFRLGMRPDCVVLCMSAEHFSEPALTDRFSLHFMVDPRDVWPLARDLQAGPALTSSLYFARFSVLYGVGPALRTALFESLLHSPGFVQDVSPPDPPPLADAALVPILADRLSAMERLCAAHRSRFVYLIPPTHEPGDLAFAAAGRTARVRVLAPVPNYALPLSDYADDEHHLNPRGAAEFTAALSRALENLQTEDLQP